MITAFSIRGLALAAAVFITLSANAAEPGTVQAPSTSLLELGYRQMYNLQFDAAHKTFAESEHQRPDDPLAPASDAAAYLFSEFDRLHVLEVELFVNDDEFTNRVKPTANPQVRQAFDERIQKARALADRALARNPSDSNALFSSVLILGLVGDYTALIEKRDLKALSYLKQGRALAEKLLSVDPACYDAYLAVGVENYLLSLKPAPVRWMLHITGAETDKQTGIAKLKITAEKGHYLLPYARMLLAVAAVREKEPERAREILRDLAREFPDNHLYATELAKLK